ncbi:hypothetical protein BGX38DRAFT_538544 [Terfezia claveryi]|nr:hypothetical protein BGX38DRAFT_538544 [Terfezia claveryi]
MSFSHIYISLPLSPLGASKIKLYGVALWPLVTCTFVSGINLSAVLSASLLTSLLRVPEVTNGQFVANLRLLVIPTVFRMKSTRNSAFFLASCSCLVACALNRKTIIFFLKKKNIDPGSRRTSQPGLLYTPHPHPSSS